MDRFIVDYDILPQSIQKVIQIQKIASTTNISIEKLCREFNIAKSTYYKYVNKIKKY